MHWGAKSHNMKTESLQSVLTPGADRVTTKVDNIHFACILNSFSWDMNDVYTNYSQMLVLSCTSVLFLLHISAGVKAEIDLSGKYLHHWDIAEEKKKTHSDKPTFDSPSLYNVKLSRSCCIEQGNCFPQITLQILFALKCIHCWLCLYEHTHTHTASPKISLLLNVFC